MEENVQNAKQQINLTVIPNIQTKLKVSQPDDPFEREADNIAEQIVGMNNKDSKAKFDNKNKRKEIINRKCSKCEKEDDDDKEELIPISRKSNTINKHNVEISNETNNKINNIIESDGGKPLDITTKEFMESRFGYDFGNVRIHTDERATKSAYLVNALAYTVGNDIVFEEGQYNPNSLDGRKLLAHELTHVVQQKGRYRHPASIRPQTGQG